MARSFLVASLLILSECFAGLAQEAAAQANKTDGGKRLVTTVYDIRDLLAKPSVLGLSSRAFRDAEPAERAARVIRAMSAIEPANGAARSNGEAIQVLNGTRLVIHASAARHAEIAALLQRLRRLGDVAVSIQAQLYEVDDAFYTSLKNVKRVSLEELERRFLEGRLDQHSLFERLSKQKKVVEGESIQVNSGEAAPLLSYHQAVRYLAGPEGLREGEKNPQTRLQGVSFAVVPTVSQDRRSVQLQLTEKAAELEMIQKIKQVTAEGQEVDAELPLFKEHTQTRVVEIPDNGSHLVPVLYRPRAAREKGRWWVLNITARIIIEEEERQIRKASAPRP
jgi:hypothetical protein